AHHVVSSAAYHDGAWHHVAATLGADGARLYVDGVRVATDSNVTYGRDSAGYWRWGGSSLAGFPNRPTSDYFTGTLDEVAIYSTQLTDQQVAWHYYANH
ncbi:MAG TPA: LamG domain-containing protein, partial [Catenuloplanes sp.]